MEDQSLEVWLRLIKSPDEPPLTSQVYQSELREIHKALKSGVGQVTCRFFAFDSYGGGGGLSGDFVILVTAFSSALIQIRMIVVAYLKYHQGRKVELKYGNKTIRGDVGDIEKLLSSEAVEDFLKPAKRDKEAEPKNEG